MAKWISKSSGALTVKLIFHWPQYLRPRSDRLFGRGVDIRHGEKNAYPGAAERGRTSEAHLRHLIGEHDMGIANLDFGVHDRAAGTVHPQHLFCTKRLFVKIEG